MAIIACPGCGKKISNQSAICPHCGFQNGEVSEEELEIFQARKLRERIYRTNMISYAVITVFIAGFAWYWWDTKGFVQPSSEGPFIVMGIAALAYLVVRAFLFRYKHLRKKMRSQQGLSRDLRRNL